MNNCTFFKISIPFIRANCSKVDSFDWTEMEKEVIGLSGSKINKEARDFKTLTEDVSNRNTIGILIYFFNVSSNLYFLMLRLIYFIETDLCVTHSEQNCL